MENKIDIHKTEDRYDKALDTFRVNKSIHEANKELILRFLDDCRFGRTVTGRAKKKIGKARLLKYLCILKRISRWVDRSFDKLGKEDLERLITEIEENFYKKDNQQNYSEETKLDFKKSLRKFYKWLGKGELLDFMDTSIKVKDVPAITREEIEELINSTPDIKLKAVLIVLFDSGARVEEFLNLRMNDLTKKKYGNENDCWWINIRYSKTYARTLPLPLCTKYLNRWLELHPERINPDAQLFPYNYPALRKRIKVLAEKVLQKRLTPHMLRHSSATYWAPKLNRYRLCAKYGWAFSSDMPDRYIKRKGIIFEEIAEKGDTDQLSKLERENRGLKDNIESLEKEHRKIKKVLDFIMPVVVKRMDEPLIKQELLNSRERQLLIEHKSDSEPFGGTEFSLDI